MRCPLSSFQVRPAQSVSCSLSVAALVQEPALVHLARAGVDSAAIVLRNGELQFLKKTSFKGRKTMDKEQDEL